MHLTMIGAGYVGLVSGACFAEFGHQVTCVDKDAGRIEALQQGRLHLYEPGLGELLQKNLRDGRLVFTTELGKAVETSLAIFIAVGTPPRGDGSADLSAVEAVGKEIAAHLNGYKVIVTKSTVPVGTGERLRQIIGKSKPEGASFDIASNPEFLREGSAVEDFFRPNRIVIGAESPQAIAILKDLYRPLYLIETPILLTNIATAEMIKYASNAFLATKISFINELANLCEPLGVDVHLVAKGMGLDGRIGSKFLHAGPGFGGSCLPKDSQALVKMAEAQQVDLRVLSAVVAANQAQRERMMGKIRSLVGPVKGKTIAVLGLAFKPNTNDLRESPALWIVGQLVKEGAQVRVYDPEAMADAKAALTEPSVYYAQDSYDAARGSDAVVLATEWNQFRNLDLERLKGAMRQHNFVDLRNVYDPDRLVAIGFRYVGVGRGAPKRGAG
ncbi:MAG TPA: UDP-glucose/GDP-mannose dehydrogenase family protein [Nitrospiria bacterium]|nr:UDP-glucose/GDP-mannose dehydrogenase family protein [Nitrospiria bacterium]